MAGRKRTTENCGTCGRMMKKQTVGRNIFPGGGGRYVWLQCFGTKPKFHFTSQIVFVPKGERI